MQKRNIIILITIGTIILMGGLAACKRGYHHRGFDEFDLAAVTGRIASRLDLTESQETELDRLAAEIADKAKTMHAGHAQRYQELADVIRQDTIDRDIVDARIGEKLEKMQAMADFVADRLIAFHSILTPEQREKIAEHIEDRSSGGCRFGMR
jgi:Spy/CpxP family protein refolding chaperone